jgi:hypothetical protein
MDYILDGANLSIAYYDALLNSWSLLSLQSGVLFDAGYSQYSVAGESARNDSLIGVFGWTVSDGGLAAGSAPAVPVVSPWFAWGVDGFILVSFFCVLLIVLDRFKK